MSENKDSAPSEAGAADPQPGPHAVTTITNALPAVDEQHVPPVQPAETRQKSSATLPETAGQAAASTAVRGTVVVTAERPGHQTGQTAGVPAAPRPAQPAAASKRPAAVVVPVRQLGQAAAPASAPAGRPGQAAAVVAAPRSVPAAPQLTPFGLHPQFAEQFELLSTMRQTRRRRFLGKLALFVGVPTLFAIVYVLVLATPRYESQFEVTYQSFQPPQTLSSGLIQTLLGGSGAVVDLGSIIYEYIRSATLLAQLDVKLHLRQYYSNSKIDYPLRLRPNASQEAFLAYYQWHIVSVSQGMGGYLTVTVQAFDPQYAYALAHAIVQATDKMVDDMTARARADEVLFAEGELQREEERVILARAALTRFENLHGDLNPQDAANQLGQIAGGLESSLAQARAQLTGLLGRIRPDSPQVANLKSQIASLEKQLTSERRRLAGTGDKTAYSEVLDQYSRLQLEQEFAKDAYLAAQQGLAVARADATRKQNYLVDFVAPSRPDQPTYWFPVTYVATAFLASLFLYAAGSLISGAFRDQAGL
jgi:capsular polysaccharide transport system permease protein